MAKNTYFLDLFPVSYQETKNRKVSHSLEKKCLVSRLFIHEHKHILSLTDNGFQRENDVTLLNLRKLNMITRELQQDNNYTSFYKLSDYAS